MLSSEYVLTFFYHRSVVLVRFCLALVCFAICSSFNHHPRLYLGKAKRRNKSLEKNQDFY